MIKVLHAAETIKGGVATVMRQLARKRVEVSGPEALVYLIPLSQTAELDDVPQMSVRSFVDCGRGVVSLWHFAIAFTRSVLHERPDIVHLHSSFAGAVGRVILFILRPVIRPRVVYCPHAFAFVMCPRGLKGGVYRFIERTLARLCDKVVCVSQYEMDAALAAGISKNKLTVIHNGVAPSTAPKRCDKRDSDLLNLLFIGRFDYQKGFDILLAAMDLLSDLPVRLTAVGGTVRASELPPAKPNIEYVGWMPAARLAEYFSVADVFVFPSRWEGLAMVPLEAMSHGLPVIASDCTSNPEIVQHGKTGMLFPTNDPVELARLIRHTAPAAWQKMGEAGFRRVNDRFTANMMLEKTERMYQEILLSR